MAGLRKAIRVGQGACRGKGGGNSSGRAIGRGDIGDSGGGGGSEA